MPGPWISPESGITRTVSGMGFVVDDGLRLNKQKDNSMLNDWVKKLTVATFAAFMAVACVGCGGGDGGGDADPAPVDGGSEGSDGGGSDTAE